MNTGNIQNCFRHGVNERDVLIHQLRHIFITRRDNNRHFLRCCLMRKRAYHVIGLYTLNHKQRQPHGLHYFVDGLHLRAQIVRHWRAIGFVFSKDIIAEGFSFRIKHHRYLTIWIVLAQAAHHVDYPLYRTCRLTFGIG